MSAFDTAARKIFDPEEYLFGKYKIVKHIGGGSFGSIFLGTDLCGDMYAIKREDVGIHHPQLRHEYKVRACVRSTNQLVHITISNPILNLTQTLFNLLNFCHNLTRLWTCHNLTGTSIPGLQRAPGFGRYVNFHVIYY